MLLIFLSNDSQNILKEYSHILKNETVLTFVYVFSMRRRKSNNILLNIMYSCLGTDLKKPFLTVHACAHSA